LAMMILKADYHKSKFCSITQCFGMLQNPLVQMDSNVYVYNIKPTCFLTKKSNN